MNRTCNVIIVFILALFICGCATTVVPKPGDITLEKAMVSVGTGLRQMREAEGPLRTGLIADEVQVTFNISASGDQGGSLKVEMTPVPSAPLFGGATGELSTKYAAQRGNQITIKFKNIMTASNKDTLCKDVEALGKLVKIIKEQGLDNIFFVYQTPTQTPTGPPQGPFFGPKPPGK